MEEPLKQVRGTIAECQGSEFAIQADQPAAYEIWQKIQQIRTKKYLAIKQTIEAVAAPFDAELQDLELEYAVFIRMAI